MEIDYEELLKIAESFAKKGIEWHHHYLPPNCLLNKTSKHLIYLEGKGQQWQSSFDEKPMKDLEKLENLFFKRS